MFKIAGVKWVFFSSVAMFAPAKPHPFVDALIVTSQLLERGGIFEEALLTAYLFETL